MAAELVAKIAYLGDGNNVLNSLLLSCSVMGMSVAVAPPEGYQPGRRGGEPRALAGGCLGIESAEITVTDDPYEAAHGADAVYTDVHVSMGMTDAATRAVALAPYKVTPEVMKQAKQSAVFAMHCLPMHRDQEVSAVVADGTEAIILDQAENRMHMQKAILLHTLAPVVA